MAVTTRRAVGGVTPAQLAKYFELKLEAELGPHNVKRLLEERPERIVLLDVRSKDGFRKSHLPGAVNIPLDELRWRVTELPKGKEIIAYCWNVTCLLSAKAAHLLASRGFRAKEMLGGIEAWSKAEFPLE